MSTFFKIALVQAINIAIAAAIAVGTSSFLIGAGIYLALVGLDIVLHVNNK